MMRPRRTTDVTLIRWVFTRGRRALTCEVRVDPRGAFQVVIIPMWDIKSAVIESYDRASAAMRRHAEIAAAFRQGGWAVTRQKTGAEVAA